MFPSVNRYSSDVYEFTISHQKSVNERPTILGAISEVTSSPLTLEHHHNAVEQAPSSSNMKFLTHVDNGATRTECYIPEPDYEQVSEPEPDYDNESTDDCSTGYSGYIKSDITPNSPLLDVDKISVMTIELMIKSGLEPRHLVNNFQQTDYINKHDLRHDGICAQLTILWMDNNIEQTGYYDYIESPTGVANIRRLINDEKERFDLLVEQGYIFSKQTAPPEKPGKYLIDLHGDNHVVGMEVLHSGSVRFFDPNTFELSFNNTAEFNEFLPIYLIAANYESEINGKDVTFYKFTKH